jgi:putative ATP-dependent endonuclease of the OLD family
MKTRVAAWNDVAPPYEDFMREIDNADGKGRFAQRLALKQIQPPAYLAAALEYLANG